MIYMNDSAEKEFMDCCFHVWTLHKTTLRSRSASEQLELDQAKKKMVRLLTLQQHQQRGTPCLP